MGKKEDFEKKYKMKKRPSIKDVLTDSNWRVDDVDYTESDNKYHFKVTNTKTGGETVVSRNKEYVDNLISELEDGEV